MISRRDERLFNQASVMATLGQAHVRVGAVLARGRRPYVWEHNVSGPTPGEPFHLGHAEARAVARSVREKSTIYVARIDRAGTLMPSMPCLTCHETLSRSPVTRIVYFDGNKLRDRKV